MTPYIHATIILWSLWLGYWMLIGFNNKRTAHRENPVARFWIGVSFWLAFAMIYSKHWGLNLPERLLLPRNAFWGVLGVMLTLLGIAFAVWARVALGTNWSGQPELKQNHELITSGPYRYARHPIYTGLFLAALGTALTIGMPRAFAGALELLVGFWYKLGLEERLMLRQFPEQYPAYRRRVKAIIPFVL